jgi:hypothetical protein
MRRLVACGQWVRLRRGIYADRCLLDFCSGDPTRRHAVGLFAAVLAAGGETHVSHESAAFLHGIATFERYDERPRLTRPSSSTSRRRRRIGYAAPSESPRRGHGPQSGCRSPNCAECPPILHVIYHRGH